MHPSPAQIIRDIYDAFGRRDMPAVFSRFSPEIEIVQSTAVPWGGVYRGHEGARKFYGTLTQTIASVVTIERIINAGDHVVAIGWTRGKVIATGATYDVPIAHVWKLQDGVIVQVQFFIDNPTMLAALAKPVRPA